MHIDTVKQYACKTCEIGLDLSECEYDDYAGEYACPRCNNFHVEVIWERPAHWFSVAIYAISRLYGGPEEGGWYYDAGERIDETVRTFKNTPEGRDEAQRYLDSLHALHFPYRAKQWHDQPHTNRISSEALPDQSFPRHRPVYC